MAHDRDNLVPEEALEQAESFDSLLDDSKELLSKLREEVTSGKGILDPNTQKKKELLAQLDPIMKKLQKQWEFLQKQEEEEKEKEQISGSNNAPPLNKAKSDAIAIAKEKLSLVMDQLKNIITAITALTIGIGDNDKEKKKEKEKEDKAIEKNIKTGINQFNKLLEEYDLLKANTIYIARLEYGKDLSSSMTIGAAILKQIVTVGLAWSSTVGEAAKAAGAIFYPVSATFTTLASLFGLLGRTTQFFIAGAEISKAEKEKVEAETEAKAEMAAELHQLELKDTKALLANSIMFKGLNVSLNFLSVLAFAGVLATPIGWGFVAAATLVDWIDNELGASRRADKALEDFEREKNSDALKAKDPTIQQRSETLQQEADNARIVSRWGSANVVAMVLIACGPIPFAGPFIGLTGLAVLGIVSIRNFYVNTLPGIMLKLADAAKYFSTEEPKHAGPENKTSSPEKRHEHTKTKEIDMVSTQAKIRESIAKNDPRNNPQIATLQPHNAQPVFTPIFQPSSNDPMITTSKEGTLKHNKVSKTSPSSSGG